jgi:hypothetical protein
MLHHPDRRTTWVGLGVLRFKEPLGTDEPTLHDYLASRLAAVQAALPLSAARIRGDRWVAGAPCRPEVVTSEDSIPAAVVRGFDLHREPPLRVVAAANGMWVTIALHHAAFDGSNVFTLFRIIAGHQPRRVPRARTFERRTVPPWSILKRLLRPADPVVPSSPPPTTDTFVSVTLPLVGRDITTRLPDACVAATLDHCNRAGAPCRRVGLSLGLVAHSGDGDISTYRRIDARAGGSLRPAIERSLAAREEPWEIVHGTRLLRLAAPFVGRVSDTLLVSNFGRVEIPGLHALECYPVARGRSALAFGAVRVSGGRSTLTLRARYLSPEDGRRILLGVIEHLTRSASQLPEGPK